MVWDRDEYAFSTWTLNRMTIIQALTSIQNAGFRSVEIWANHAHLDPALKPNVRETADFLKTHAMRAHSVHSPYAILFQDMADEKSYRAFRMDTWRQTLDFCETLECNKMVIHALDSIYRYRPDQADIVRECLETLVAYGKKRGVMLALENIPFGLQPDVLVCTLENQTKLFGGFGLKYCLDIGHVSLNGGQMNHEIDSAIHDLVSFHINNNDGVHDLHAMPDQGILNWPEIYTYARQSGYQGKFVLEINGGTDQEATLRRAAALFQ